MGQHILVLGPDQDPQDAVCIIIIIIIIINNCIYAWALLTHLYYLSINIALFTSIILRYGSIH